MFVYLFVLVPRFVFVLMFFSENVTEYLVPFSIICVFVHVFVMALVFMCVLCESCNLCAIFPLFECVLVSFFACILIYVYVQSCENVGRMCCIFNFSACSCSFAFVYMVIPLFEFVFVRKLWKPGLFFKLFEFVFINFSCAHYCDLVCFYDFVCGSVCVCVWAQVRKIDSLCYVDNTCDIFLSSYSYEK